MTDSPTSDAILDFSGPDGETLFRHFVVWCLPVKWESEVQRETDEVFAHLRSDDDRAVALVGAMIVQDAVDALAAAHAPGYKRLAENRDFSFSLRIELVRALRLCPSRLLSAADTIRTIRNDFAHELSIKAFGDCDQKNLNSARGHLAQVHPKMVDGKTDREVFVALVGMIRLALRGYGFHVERLNAFVRNAAEFKATLRSHCLTSYPQLQPTIAAADR